MTTQAQSSRRPSHLRAHAPSYLTGGAAGALVAAALVAFLSVATFVAFKGMPSTGSGDNSGTAYVEPSAANTAGAPAAAGAALGAAPGAVAKNAVPRSPGGGAGASAGSGQPSGPSAPSGTTDPSGGVSPAPGANPSPSDPGGAPAPAPAPAPSPAPSVPSTTGPVTNAVQDVDTATGTNLSGPTSGLTGTVDNAATGTLNQAGAAVGQPHLGDNVGGAVKGVTDGVLGGGGHDGVLGGGSQGGLLGSGLLGGAGH
jgi:hypothetical protein